MDFGARDKLLSCLAEAVGAAKIAHPTRVAIDGVPAAGKTTLADELAVVLRAQGREIIRATIVIPRDRGRTVLSPSTVKSQAVSIYHKLGAATRSQAVTRARELGLLEG